MDLTLYAITDPKWTFSDKEFFKSVEESLKGGVSILQLREKKADFKTFLNRAKELNKIAQFYGVPLIINDNLKVMEESNADGIHVGEDDTDTKTVRERYPSKIVGATCKSVEKGLLKMNYADYFGVGAINVSDTKKDAKPIDIKTLNEIKSQTGTKIVAIGGINYENCDNLKGAMIDGIAVSGAIYGSDNIFKDTKLLKEKIIKIMEEKNV